MPQPYKQFIGKKVPAESENPFGAVVSAAGLRNNLIM